MTDSELRKEKSWTLRLQTERKEFVGSRNNCIVLQKQGTGVYKLLFTGWWL
jgi:hypothetical protein